MTITRVIPGFFIRTATFTDYYFLAGGSCSGCDALEACDTYAEVDELINKLKDDIKWLPRKEMIEYFHSKDWKTEATWRDEESDKFKKECLEALEQ